MSTTVVGLGNIGSRLAKNLTVGGQEIIIADRTLAKAEDTRLRELGSDAEAMPVAASIAKAEVVASSQSTSNAIKQLVCTYRDALAGKIVVDPSNPIAPDGKGGFKKIISTEQSSGQLISGLLPDGRSPGSSKHSAH